MYKTECPSVVSTTPNFRMKITVVAAVACLTLCVSETMGALKVGLGTGLELPVLGELDTDVAVGVNVQKGLLGISKLLVKGLLGKATSAILKGNRPKDAKLGTGNEPRLPLKFGNDAPRQNKEQT